MSRIFGLLEQKKLRKVDVSRTEDCQCCKDKDRKIKRLENENEDLKTRMRGLIEKMELYKQNSDKYSLVVELIKSQESYVGIDKMALIDSTHQVCLDISYPNIMINVAQKNALKAISNVGAAARALIDMLFEVEEFKAKNYSMLEKEYPEKISAIKNYLVVTYKCDPYKVTKAITNKCKGY